MQFAMKRITFGEAFRRIGLAMLLLAVTKSGCNGASNSNPGGGNPPAASIASVSHDQRSKLWSDARNEHGDVQRCCFDSDDLERDHHCFAGTQE